MHESATGDIESYKRASAKTPQLKTRKQKKDVTDAVGYGFTDITVHAYTYRVETLF